MKELMRGLAICLAGFIVLMSVFVFLLFDLVSAKGDTYEDTYSGMTIELPSGWYNATLGSTVAIFKKDNNVIHYEWIDLWVQLQPDIPRSEMDNSAFIEGNFEDGELQKIGEEYYISQQIKGNKLIQRAYAIHDGIWHQFTMITTLDGEGLRDFDFFLKSVKFVEPENPNGYTSSDETGPKFTSLPSSDKAQDAMGTTVARAILCMAAFNLVPVMIYLYVRKRSPLNIRCATVFGVIYTVLSAAIIALSAYIINLSMYIGFVAIPLGVIILIIMRRAAATESLTDEGEINFTK